MKELAFSRKLFYFFPVLLCFCLPFGSVILSWIIVFWTLNSFFTLEKEQVIKAVRNPLLWLFWGFFLATVLSALFSSDKYEASFSVEVKLAFLLFPYLFFFFSWPVDILRRCIISFVSGCFFACVYLLGRAFLYALNGQPEYFFYTLFSDLLHASYFAMYLLMAVVFVFTLYPTWFRNEKSVIYGSWFFAVIFIATIFLCSSKMGIITLLFTLPALFVTRMRRKWSLSNTLFTGAGLIIAMILLLYFLPGASERITRLLSFDSSQVDKNSAESTMVRFLIWEQCLQLIRENFWLGTGVGDANNALYQSYISNGLNGALSHKLNAHNQFFQTFIGMGLPGFLLLLAMTLGQLIRGLWQRKLLLTFFSFLVLMNFLVESMLQTSAGVIFFTFFSCLFFVADHLQLQETVPTKAA